WNEREGLLENAIDYRGSPRRVYISPVLGRDLSVITFGAQRPVHTVVAEILGSSLVLFFVYLVGLLVLLFFIRLVTVPAVPGGYRAAWLWPSRDREMVRRYYRAAALLATTGMVALWVLDQQEGPGTVVLLWSLPVATVALLRVELGFPAEGPSRSRRLAGGAAGAAAVASLAAI